MQIRSRQYGLIGYPLGHSYSKKHFSIKFEREGLTNCTYLNFEISEAGMLPSIIRGNPDLIGLNVTIPHKQSVLMYLDELDPVAAEIGAVNTISIRRTDSQVILTGYNTDVVGFIKSIEAWNLPASVRALVLGSGGSSLAIKYALRNLGIEFLGVTRRPEAGCLTYEELSSEMAGMHHLWINCTPVGMYPATGGLLPLPFGCLTPQHHLFDLIYNPPVTGFLEMGIQAGARVMNGSSMLYEQAEASWEIWNR